MAEAKSEVRVTQADIDAREDFKGVHAAMGKILDLVKSRTVELPEVIIDNTYRLGYLDAPKAAGDVRVPDSPAALEKLGDAPVSPAPMGAGTAAVGELVRVDMSHIDAHPLVSAPVVVPDQLGLAAAQA